MTWSKSQARSYLTLVTSTRMPWWAHYGWLKHYPIVYLWSDVRYHPTHRYMKLLSLGILSVPYKLVHNQMLIHSDPIDTGFNWHRRGATTLELRIYDPDNSHPSYLVFSLSPNCPTQSPIMPTFSTILPNPHRTSFDRKGPIMSGFQPLVFYR
jgi:hypothetical protein